MSEDTEPDDGQTEPVDESDESGPAAEPEEVLVVPEWMLPEVVGKLATAVEQHAQEIEGLTSLHETFAALEASLLEKADLTRPSRWAWQFLTRDEAALLWKETRWFVDYLVHRYPLISEVSIPPCWYRHAIAVDELSDLYAGWRATYCASDRPTTSMTTWRERSLWPVLQRLASYADWRECKERRKHVEPTARQDPTDEEFAAFVTADVAQRPAGRSTTLPWPTKKPAGQQAPPVSVKQPGPEAVS